MRPKSALHDYQDKLVSALYEADRLIAVVPMGGGKTVSALTAVQELIRDGEIRSGIVLAPKRVAQAVWPPEVGEWVHLQGMDVRLLHGGPEARLKALSTPADLYVLGIDNTQWLTEQIEAWDDDDPRLDLLIIDELSRYKSPTGRRSRALAFVREKFRNVWGLTGTPAPNGELDLYMPGRLVAGEKFWAEPFDYWRERRFIATDWNRYNWAIRDEWKDRTWSEISEYMHVVDESQLPPQPELRTIRHMVELPPEARRLYDEMLRHLLIEVNFDIVEAMNRAVASGKLDQLAQGFVYKDGETLDIVHTQKTDALMDLVGGLGGEQAMITYWFAEDLLMLRGVLGKKVPVLGSETTDKEADRIVAAWNAGDIEHLLVHPASAGHGLNLQKGHAGQIIHYSPTWSPELYAQVNKRVARQGNERSHVMNHLILANVPTDIEKARRVEGKIADQNAFVEFAARQSR